MSLDYSEDEYHKSIEVAANAIVGQNGVGNIVTAAMILYAVHILERKPIEELLFIAGQIMHSAEETLYALPTH